MFNFKDKVVFITGAGNGMGRETALTFSKLGANIVAVDLNIEAVNETKDLIVQQEGSVEAIQVNVTNEDDIKSAVSKAVETFGTIDILINCAGISKNMPITEMSVEDWDRIFDINVKGTFLAIREVLPYMMKQETGKIVNFSSMLGKEAASEAAAYSASKFAVMGITQSVAKEVAKYNINVNAVCPGIVMTEMMKRATIEIANLQNISEEEVIQQFCEDIPLNRLQSPEDVAGVVTFLCSELAVNMTGQGINITGGAQLH